MADQPLDVKRPFVCGFLKARNEIVREGNITRCLENMIQFCDTLVVCDDASTDGTDLIIEEFFKTHAIPLDQFLRVSPEEQDFRKELAVKQRMLEKVHELEPRWVWWQDADEVVPNWFDLLRYIEALQDGPAGGWRFPYKQLWRSGQWIRVDDGFADGAFVKLWRWRADLRFEIVERTHHRQFPENLGVIVDTTYTPNFVLHFGNYGKNLQWKCIQYHGGLGGVGRHLNFEQAEYELLPTNYEAFPTLSESKPHTPKPRPFTAREKTLISMMGNLTNMREWFTVVVPTHNRAEYLDKTLQSLLEQTYQKWIAIVLDDGSTDNTPELMKFWQREPRIFYARHPKRGAVAINEIGMRFACHATGWWTRLGSDDYFEPEKLALDALALQRHAWCYGPYRVLRQKEGLWEAQELCNNPEEPLELIGELRRGHFRVSWANMAARTSMLSKVRKRHGSFGDPSLQNMEDFLFNARLTRFCQPVFRARTMHDSIIIAHDESTTAHATQLTIEHRIRHDAIWRVNPRGTSASESTTPDDQQTRLLIAQEFNLGTHNEEA